MVPKCWRVACNPSLSLVVTVTYPAVRLNLLLARFQRVFFKTFKNKTHTDYASTVDTDESRFALKCTIHIHGAKCDIILDRHFKTVELSGIGFKKWREERFPRIEQSLFKRLMQEMDSMIEDQSQNESVSEELSDLQVQQDMKIDVNGYVAPKCNVAQLNVTPNCTNELVNDAQSHGGSEDNSDPERKPVTIPSQPVTHSNFLFTAENITDQYSRCVNVANTLGENLNPILDKYFVTQPTPTLNHDFQVQYQNYTTTPAFSSTPIVHLYIVKMM